jgi:hypothetical protein
MLSGDFLFSREDFKVAARQVRWDFSGIAPASDQRMLRLASSRGDIAAAAKGKLGPWPSRKSAGFVRTSLSDVGAMP